MKRKISSALLFSLSGMLLLGGCKKEGENNDEEVITTMMLHFTPTTGGSGMLMFSSDDPDGPNGNNPIIQDIVLQPNTTYNVSVEFIDKTKNPDVDITEEVRSEGEAHRIYFEPSANSNITINNLDNDADGLPLGLKSTWTTGAATSSGSVKVTLRHYNGNPPNKAANDDVNSNKSSTDAQATFNTRLN